MASHWDRAGVGWRILRSVYQLTPKSGQERLLCSHSLRDLSGRCDFWGRAKCPIVCTSGHSAGPGAA
jgi:hypothetical protein